jgi:sensor histidine kinase regulating citrate/malate metabolism
MSAWGIGIIVALCSGGIAAALVALRAWQYRLADRRVAAFHNDLVARHVEEVQNIYREMRGWRHDYHNHIQTMKAYHAMGQDERLDEYLSNLDADLAQVDLLIKSGNVMVDAILNSKLALATNGGIKVNAGAVVPTELSVADIDLCVIIGNLLDNAIEACRKIEDATVRFIRVYIDIKRDSLYISVTNAATGRPPKSGGRYVSVKPGMHGFGLARVDRLVRKYGGYISRRDEEGAFTTEIILNS